MAASLRLEVLRSLVNTFQPFGRRAMEEIGALEAEWERLFDGEEVLPEVLLHRARAETSWLGRARYLVPVSRSQLACLAVQERLDFDKELGVFVVKAAYDSDSGLELTRPD